MTAALAQAHLGTPFNTDFYAAAATIIPLLFVALAVEGHFIQDLLSEFSRAGETSAVLGRLQEILVIFSRPSRSVRTRLIVYRLVAVAVAVLSAGIVVYAAISEIFAILALYWQAAAHWMGALVLTGTIFLMVAVGAGPALALARLIIADFRRDKSLADALQGADVTEVPQRTGRQDGGNDSAGTTLPAPAEPAQAAASDDAGPDIENEEGLIVSSAAEPVRAQPDALVRRTSDAGTRDHSEIRSPPANDPQPLAALPGDAAALGQAGHLPYIISIITAQRAWLRSTRILTEPSLLADAEAGPKTTVLSAWAYVETTISDLARALGVSDEPSLALDLDAVLGELAGGGALKDRETTRLVLQSLTRRKTPVEHGEPVRPADAYDYAVTALYVTNLLLGAYARTRAESGLASLAGGEAR